jgi:hypothetical protein
MPRLHSVEALQAATHRTIPSARTVLSTSPASLKLFAGKYVWMKAIGGDVTMLRKNQAVSAGNGFVLKTDSYQELFVDPSDDLTLSFVDGTIEVLYDD